MSDADAQKVMKQLQKAMVLNLWNNLWRHGRLLLSWIKKPEKGYIEEDLYQSVVIENVNTGLTGPVIKRGTNYIIFVDEYDNKHRSWLKDIVEGEDPSTQWEIGTDKYRSEVQAMTPGQPVTSFYDFVKKRKKTK